MALLLWSKTTSSIGAFGRMPLTLVHFLPPLVVSYRCEPSSPVRKPENATQARFAFAGSTASEFTQSWGSPVCCVQVWPASVVFHRKPVSVPA